MLDSLMTEIHEFDILVNNVSTKIARSVSVVSKKSNLLLPNIAETLNPLPQHYAHEYCVFKR